MRLLTAAEPGGWKVTKDLLDHLPPYAILSHTWGDEDDEVTFDDIEKHQGLSKRGYQKVSFCVDQAERDGLQHVWIDTCCINKASQPELSEAITSMFHWYRRSARCYVYLSDVKIEYSQEGIADPKWEHDFRNSRWFMRGWTLQELIAPDTVEFFARDGQRLGDKASLERMLWEITKIPVDALRGADLSQFPVEQRLQWASGRNTKKIEDRAYCLIGLLELSMSLRYGEGDNAFKRLKAKVQKRVTGDYQRGGPSPDLQFNESNRRESIMGSLYFPDMDARRQQISPPSSGTFRWLLDTDQPHDGLASTFVNFLRDTGDRHKLFWISGIPGSGKSSLMAYLLETLQLHLAEGGPPSYFSGNIASYFFWSPASNALQKSSSGMMRTLLYTLFEQNPEVIRSSVTLRRWQRASSTYNSVPGWTQTELMDTLKNLAYRTQRTKTTLLFIDGLDEIEGGSSEQAELVDAIHALSNLPNTKLCVSSRPLPVFAEAFSQAPLLRLQDLNGSDISRYVNDTMKAQRSFQALQTYHRHEAQHLIDLIITRAEGVFLWVRLVVKDLIACLRDGGDLPALKHTLEEIPIDLESYFQRIIDSIDPKYRVEASLMLQIALWEEDEFTSLQTLRLLDFCFFEEVCANMSRSMLDSNPLNLKALQETKFRLSVTLRKLQSRCKGLLLCHNLTTPTHLSSSPLSPSEPTLAESLTDDISLFRDEPVDCLFAFDSAVDFLHRSLRDFLLSPGCYQRLSVLTDGPVNARKYLCLTRLYEAEALMAAGLSTDMIVFLASHVISAAATPAMRWDAVTLQILARLEPVIHHLVTHQSWRRRGIYLGTSLHAWNEESSNFLTLAIDFNIETYIARYLTSDHVRLKRGRPLLDYVLRPRFTGNPELGIGLSLPSPGLTARMLSMGADPNTVYDGSSLFVLYLCFMNDYLRTLPMEQEITSLYETTAVLMQCPIPINLPERWLRHDGFFDAWSTDWRSEDSGSYYEIDWFQARWSNAPPLQSSAVVGNPRGIATADVLEHFRSFFGDRVDTLISMLGRT